MMKHKLTLMVASLLSILLTTLHVADDVVRGMAPGTLFTLEALVPILVIWLYGTLVLADRRSGYIIILVGSLIGLLQPILHMKGAGIGAKITTSGGALFFVWTLIALATTSLFSVILAVRGLWEQRSGKRLNAP